VSLAILLVGASRRFGLCTTGVACRLAPTFRSVRRPVESSLAPYGPGLHFARSPKVVPCCHSRFVSSGAHEQPYKNGCPARLGTQERRAICPRAGRWLMLLRACRGLPNTAATMARTFASGLACSPASCGHSNS